METTARVQENLEVWCNPPIPFPWDDVGKAYRERTRRIADAILLKKPGWIPLMSMWEFFYAKYAGYTCEEVMYDAKKAEDSVVRTVTDLQPDWFQGPIFFMTGPVLEVYDAKDVPWPDHGLPMDQAHQFVEGEYMKAGGYDAFLDDPSDFMLKYYLPRVLGNLESLVAMSPIRRDFACFTDFGGWAGFGSPGGLKALDAIRKMSVASFDYASFLGSVVGKLVMMGFPPWSGSLTEAPFDVRGDTLRGTRGIMPDMYRQPDVLKKACERIVDIMAEYTMTAARGNSNHPIVFTPARKGKAATRDGKGVSCP